MPPAIDCLVDPENSEEACSLTADVLGISYEPSPAPSLHDCCQQLLAIGNETIGMGAQLCTTLYESTAENSPDHPDRSLELLSQCALTFTDKSLSFWQLSGGQQQLFLVLITLHCNTRAVLLLDEPTTGLDCFLRNLLRLRMSSFTEKHTSSRVAIATHSTELITMDCLRCLHYVRQRPDGSSDVRSPIIGQAKEHLYDCVSFAPLFFCRRLLLVQSRDEERFFRSLVDTLALGGHEDFIEQVKGVDSARDPVAELAEYTVLAIHNVDRISEAFDVANRLGIPCKAVLSSAALELDQVCGVKLGANSEAERRGRLEARGIVTWTSSFAEMLAKSPTAAHALRENQPAAGGAPAAAADVCSYEDFTAHVKKTATEELLRDRCPELVRFTCHVAAPVAAAA